MEMVNCTLRLNVYPYLVTTLKCRWKAYLRQIWSWVTRLLAAILDTWRSVNPEAPKGQKAREEYNHENANLLILTDW